VNLKKTIQIGIILFISFVVAKSADAAITIRPALNLGLVGYWSMDEGAGNKAYDQSGNINAGTLTQMDPATDWVDGKLGKALDFDGVNDYVDMGDINALDGLTKITASAWIKTTKTTETHIVDKSGCDGATNGGPFELLVNGFTAGKAVFAVYKSGGTPNFDYAESSTSVNDNNWYHVVGTYDGSFIRIYVDGVERGSKAASGWTLSSSTGFVQMGGYCNNNSYPWNGLIDEVRVYNRALSAGEITRLYQLTKPKILAPNNLGLVGYWSFEEGLGTKAGDMSGRGNNGTLIGSPAWVNGKRGRALNFPNTGGDDWVDLGTSFNISSVPFTISAWINPVDYANFNTIIGKRDSWVANDMRFQFQLQQTGGSVRLDGSPSNIHSFFYSPPTNTWTFLTAIATVGSTDLYVNGAFQESLGGFTLGTDSAAQAAIGRNGEALDPDPFRGKIDEVRIYNRALSASEVASLYQSSGKKTTINSSQNTQLTTGLVGLWSFNGPDIAGSIALDRSGQGNNGTITGAIPTIGKVGQALKFDGSDDYIISSASTSINNLASMTLSIWSKANSYGEGGQGYIVTKSSGCCTVSDGWILKKYITNQNLFFTVDYDGAANLYAYSAGYSFPTSDFGKWIHWAVTWNGAASSSGIHFYKDGTEIAQGSAVDGVGNRFSDTSSNLFIGNDAGGGAGRTFDGTMDEVRIYNRVLSAYEIMRLYNMGR